MNYLLDRKILKQNRFVPFQAFSQFRLATGKTTSIGVAVDGGERIIKLLVSSQI